MPSLELRGVRKTLGKNLVLRGVDLDVPSEKLCVLVGPSGCGKSTVLRTIAGLETPDAGTIRIGERDVTQAAPRERDVAMVFQSYALYPHMTVRENLGFGLSIRGEERKVIDERVREVGKRLGLGPLLDRLPKQLSGGQRQRVAMGRAIARRPALFLFDEPLSNLDAALRGEVRVEIKKLHEELRATMVYVTHDQTEAMTLADVLVVLDKGTVAQSGAPLDVYRAPASKFVAGFLGTPPMSFLRAELAESRVRAAGLDVPASRAARAPKEGTAALLAGIRAHDVRRTKDGERADLTLEVDVVEALGSESFAHGTVGEARFVARIGAADDVRPGQSLPLVVQDGCLHLFDVSSEKAL